MHHLDFVTKAVAFNDKPLHAQATQQELAEAHAALTQIGGDLKDMQQQYIQREESLQAAMRAQADRAAQQLTQVSASLKEAQNESAQVMMGGCKDIEVISDSWCRKSR